jgi:replicative DNA helicase
MTHGSDISPLTRVVARLDRAAAGHVDAGVIPTRFPSLDRAIGGGFRRGELVVIGGDDSAGTSSLALGIALRSPQSALLLTSEMHPERVFERALALSAKVPLESLRMGLVQEGERLRLASAATMLRDRAPVVETLGRGGVAEVERASLASPELPLVIVDALEGLLDTPTGRSEALGYAVLELKRLALRRNIVVLCTMHPPGLDLSRADRRPRLPDFGLEGAVGAHADLVAGLYREELYESDLGVSGAAELILLKHRDGPRGYVDLYFDSRFGRFEDVLEE